MEPHVRVCTGKGLVAKGVVGVSPQVLLLDHLRQQHYVHPAPACSVLSFFQMAAQQVVQQFLPARSRRKS